MKSRYLTVLAVGCAGVLLVAFLIVEPVQSKRGIDYLLSNFAAVVGISVAVEENPYNMLAVQLEKKDAGLTAREQELNSRAAALQKAEQKVSDTRASVAIAALGVLAVFSMWFFVRRMRKKPRSLL